jgi:hypothetical protein
MSSADAVMEVVMSRVSLAFLAAMALATVGATRDALAQAGCQPTIMQPCTNVPNPPNAQLPKRTGVVRANESNAPKDQTPRIKLDQDTDFKFGTGGIGIGRKF